MRKLVKNKVCKLKNLSLLFLQLKNFFLKNNKLKILSLYQFKTILRAYFSFHSFDTLHTTTAHITRKPNINLVLPLCFHFSRTPTSNLAEICT